MALTAIVRQVLIGVGVGAFCMGLMAIIVVVLLIYRRKYLEHDPKIITREPTPMLDNWSQLRDPSGMDMSRTVAFNRRSFHTNDRRHISSGLLDASRDPTLRPLHSYNDPFYHRERSTSSRDASPMNTRSNRGGIAVVPFRESNLPNARASFSPNGRIRTQREELGSESGSDHSRTQFFQGARAGRVPPRLPNSTLSDHRSGSEEGRGRAAPLGNHKYSRNFLRSSDQTTSTSSQEREMSYRTGRPQDMANPTPGRIVFPRASLSQR